MRFEGKVVVITGGNRGIGLGITKRFLSEGAKVAVIGTRPESVDPVISDLSNTDNEIRGYALNVADREKVEETFKKIAEDFGTIDVLVNNAGITRDTLLMRMKEDDWDAVIDINLKGAFNCLKAVTRPMMKARKGRIINISSVVGLTGNAGQANYSASKAGLFGLTKSAAKELAARNITVNAIAPGYIATEMTDAVSDEARDAFLRNIPLARPGQADEVAAAIAFLASDDAAYITGQTVNVDGGLVM
ncbi:MAG: 3-oxoacyl-[acyl-carrier-protein] reductase [Lentisphaeraceae bacterium]|nr:3-oxoacyl-[acyl-carrier-protein] reductase [Lentisphaeraceae bacterium]